LETLPAASKRISIGVQTLKPESIEEMGRKRFGNLETIDKLIGKAHKRDISVNGDFLINMPNQPVAAMLSDIETAIRIGFDQICLYSLVLFEGLGSTWSRMPEKLAGMPQVETAYANWLRVRQMLLEAGFVQTTQTNFERQEVNQGPNKFRYELSSFDPSGVDGIGFGPAGITMITDPKSQRGIKILNTHKSMRYAEQIEKSDTAFGFWHYYSDLDDLLMGLWARNFSRGFVRRIEGYDPVERHPELIAALVEAGLLTISPKRVEVTTRGSFFTDTIIGLLTEERAQQIREGNQENQRIIARNHLNDYTDFYGDSDDWGGGGM